MYRSRVELFHSSFSPPLDRFMFLNPLFHFFCLLLSHRVLCVKLMHLNIGWEESEMQNEGSHNNEFNNSSLYSHIRYFLSSVDWSANVRYADLSKV